MVGCVAVALAVTTVRAEARRNRKPRSEFSFPRAALVLVTTIALADTIIGPHFILIGLLITGPALATLSLQPRSIATISAWSVTVAVALGAPDRIWFTPETRHLGRRGRDRRHRQHRRRARRHPPTDTHTRSLKTVLDIFTAPD